jgi:hypothetical protein
MADEYRIDPEVYHIQSQQALNNARVVLQNSLKTHPSATDVCNQTQPHSTGGGRKIMKKRRKSRKSIRKRSKNKRKRKRTSKKRKRTSKKRKRRR